MRSLLFGLCTVLMLLSAAPALASDRPEAARSIDELVASLPASSVVDPSAVAVAGQRQSAVMTTTVQIGERSLWRKLLRGTARVATFGVVQAATDTVKQGQPFSLSWDHNGVDTDGYLVFSNTQQIATVPVSALANGTALYAFPSGLAKGTYTFMVRAYGPGGESADSAPLGLSVTAGNPSAPGQLKIIK